MHYNCEETSCTNSALVLLSCSQKKNNGRENKSKLQPFQYTPTNKKGLFLNNNTENHGMER